MPSGRQSDEEVEQDAAERASLEIELRACAADILTALGFLTEAAAIER